MKVQIFTNCMNVFWEVTDFCIWHSWRSEQVLPLRAPGYCSASWAPPSHSSWPEASVAGCAARAFLWAEGDCKRISTMFPLLRLLFVYTLKMMTNKLALMHIKWTRRPPAERTMTHTWRQKRQEARARRFHQQGKNKTCAVAEHEVADHQVHLQ